MKRHSGGSRSGSVLAGYAGNSIRLHHLMMQVGLAFASIGRWVLLLREAFRTPREFRKYRYNLVRQMVAIGLTSLPIVMLAAAFTGAVTTVQADYQMKSPFIPESGVGTIVTASTILETGVLITAFILAGRVGARIAAELGSMRVDDQIDALEVMGINAAGYLIVPRVVAGTLMFPLLYIAACFVGITSGILLAESSGIVTAPVFLEGARAFFASYDIFYGMIKAVVFGFLLTSISCYKGYHTTGGAEGVGRSATQAAVLSCVYILLADYVLAEVLL